MRSSFPYAALIVYFHTNLHGVRPQINAALESMQVCMVELLGDREFLGHNPPMKAKNEKHAQRQGRMDIETWLESALEALAAKGPQVLTVDKLCRELGVSRGSFYWHFKNRADFVQRLAEFWNAKFTLAVRDTVASAPVGPAERLMLLIETIQDSNVIRFDVPVRAWASTEPLAAEVVRQSDATRYRYVRSQFQELGFSGDELDMRTRTFVVFHSLDNSFTLGEGAKARKRRRKLRHRLLTSK